jgi:hypothetical protein
VSVTFTHEVPDGTETYVRSGECCQCGECCKTGDPFNGELGMPAIEGACPLLALAGDKHVCTDRQHPYYLNGCNVFPTHPLQIVDKPGCSYSFRRVA